MSASTSTVQRLKLVALISLIASASGVTATPHPQEKTSLAERVGSVRAALATNDKAAQTAALPTQDAAPASQSDAPGTLAQWGNWRNY